MIRHDRVRFIAVITLVSCVAASATEPEMYDCPPVTKKLCRVYEDKYNDAKVAMKQSGGNGSVTVPSIGISGGGQQTTVRVPLSEATVIAIGQVSEKCATALNLNGSPYALDAFWNGPFWQTLNPGQHRCRVSPDGAVGATPADGVSKPPPTGNEVAFDVELGVPTGVRVGLAFGENAKHAVGARVAVGVGVQSTVYPAAVAGVFGRVGLGDRGRFAIEPGLNFVIVGSYAGAAVALDFRGLLTDPQKGPALGLLGGVQVGAASSSVVIVPDAALVLAW